MKTTYYLLLLALMTLFACSRPETPKNVPFELMPNGLKKKIEAELMESMKREVIDYHIRLDKEYSNILFTPCDIEKRNFLNIKKDAFQQIRINDNESTIAEIRNRVRTFYLANEALTPAQTREFIRNPDYEFIDYPFHSLTSKKLVRSEIWKNTQESKLAEEREEDDYQIFYSNLAKHWREKLSILRALQVDEIKEIHPQAQINIRDRSSQSGLSQITLEAIKGMIEVRDYVSKKYTGVSYMDLYFRGTRNIRWNSKAQLEAINSLIPLIIMDYEFAKRNELFTPWFVEVELPIEPLNVTVIDTE